MKYIFLDTETTGLEPSAGDRIVEIAAVVYHDHQRADPADGGEYHRYLNPQRPMPAEALAIHNLDDAFLADKPLFADIADEFITFITGGNLVMHNAEFDKGFLNAELNRLGKPPLETFAASITCSLEWARANIHSIGVHNLNALCKHFDINLDERADYHSAIVDTRLLGELYHRMRQQQTEISMNTPALKISASGGPIALWPASADELAAHETLLAAMQKETKITPLYHRPPDAADNTDTAADTPPPQQQ